MQGFTVVASAAGQPLAAGAAGSNQPQTLNPEHSTLTTSRALNMKPKILSPD